MVNASRFTPDRRLITLVAGLLAAALVGGGVALAASPEPPIRTTTPRTERDVTNVDVVKQQVKNYYGDPLGTGTIDPHSNYVAEVSRVERQVERYLKAPHPTQGRKAVVVDVDDTTLNSWAFQLSTNFAFNSAAWHAWGQQQRYVPVPGMPDLLNQAAREGYAIFYLTGRDAPQEASTLGNLTADGVGVDAGFPTPTPLGNGEDGLLTEPAVADYPGYLKAACALDTNGTCTTVHYKAATRAHLESLGYDIVANLGDQNSDFTGGHAQRTFKLPNPTYVIP